MGTFNMPEPTTTTAAGAAAGWKLIGGLAGIATIGAAAAATVVMCMTPPRTPREWAVALICTVMSSIGGGAAAIQYLGLQHWAHELTGLVAMLGLVFACGLPGWAMVRWVFNYIAKREGKGIDEVIQEARVTIKESL